MEPASASRFWRGHLRSEMAPLGVSQIRGIVVSVHSPYSVGTAKADDQCSDSLYAMDRRRKLPPEEKTRIVKPMRQPPLAQSGNGCRRSVPNVLLLGPPGAGKSMLARRLTTILPAMTLAEALETTRIHRVAGLTGARTALVTTRPCRAPHHTLSDVGRIGGGHVSMPGDVSRAHHGVRFLDERPEF